MNDPYLKEESYWISGAVLLSCIPHYLSIKAPRFLNPQRFLSSSIRPSGLSCLNQLFPITLKATNRENHTFSL